MESPASQASPAAPGPLSAVLIDRRLYVYGLDVCARLRYRSLKAFAATVPLECARAVNLADQHLPATPIQPGHPLDHIRTVHEPSLWIDLPGLFLLFQWSAHPLAKRFGVWMALQRSTFLGAVPPCLLGEGLWLLREAVGPAAQVLAEFSETDPYGNLGSRRLLNPPRVQDLSRLVVAYLKSEAASEPAPTAG
ncbi:hypothetical protein [Flindersiella endophytica]